ncbi:phage tail tape measure protein [Pseudomonas syringae]|uniref:Tail protein n=1 Tax=Pseudomonas syringae TaxID=317 RepID=A0A085V497_PSESX|nr:phage tail tape measure protein [Pseudomonas syringae]KFE50260.1 tail protein [Pseudomonas syringae]
MADRSARLAFILSLTDKVSAPLGRVKTSFADLATQGQQNIMKMGTGLAGMVGAGVAISESLEPALEMNRALGEVRSLGVAEDALSALNKKSLEFSVNYAANARDFVASAYSISGAIKGLTGDQLANFTNTSNLLAKATKSDAETMGAYLGTMYNLFKTSADAMGKTEWVEKLGGQTALAVKLFRTDGAQLKDAFKEVGAIATGAGVDIAEQFAVIGTLSSTMEGGDAGGRYKAFFENAANGAKTLGVTLTDQQGKMLPILDVLDKLQGKLGDLNGASASAKLLAAFGGEGAQVIGALAKDTDRLRSGIAELGKVRGLENAEKMAKAMVDPWQQFGAAVQALRIAFGQALIPMLAPLMDKLVGIASTLTRWTQLFPNLTRMIAMITLGFLGLVVAIGAMTVIGSVVGMLSMLASPIVLIVIAIAALVIGVGLGIYYWDRLKASFGDTAWFQAIVVMLTPVVLLFRVFTALLNVLWVGLQQVFAFGMQVVDWIGQMVGVTVSANTVWDAFIWALTNISPFAIIGKALKGLIELLNKIPGINIDTTFGEVPKVPDVAGIESPVPSTPAVDRALQAAQLPLAGRPALSVVPPLVMAPAANDQAEQARQKMAATNASVSPTRPTAVPQGGLLRSIQNTSNQQTQNKGTHVENMNIYPTKPITPLEIENMMSMAVPG